MPIINANAHWALFWTHFDFTISYQPGTKNIKPGMLSRQFSTTDSNPPTVTKLSRECILGTVTWDIERVVKRSLTGTSIPWGCPDGKLYVPRATRQAVLCWCHASKLNLTWQLFWWQSMRHDIQCFVKCCSVSAQSKSNNVPPAGLLQPLPIPTCPWSHISMDFVTGLSPSLGNTVILIIVDRFSKSARFISVPKLLSAKEKLY